MAGALHGHGFGPKTGAMRLIADHLSLFRGERLVLRDLCLALPAGGAAVLTGPNGAGKSSALRLLAGLATPAGGRLSFDGSDDLAGKTALLGHLDAIKPGLSVIDNLAFAASLSAGNAQDALARMGLGGLAALPARLLSAGQRRRLALARLLLSAAPLWLLDEPSVGLDHAAITRLGEALAMHRAAGGVVVASTHVPLPLPDAQGVVL